MTDKLDVDEIAVGAIFEAVFVRNPQTESRFYYKASHLDKRRAPKVVLSSDSRIQPGVTCLVKVESISKPDRDDRGYIEVSLHKLMTLDVKGIYLDPDVRDKLQILLDSGLNILLDGPQGCGKTVLAKSIAQALGMTFVYFNCGPIVEASDFLATIMVVPSEDGKVITQFVKTELLIRLEEAIDNPEQRYLVFLDELNRTPESARNSLMPALDSSRRLFHPIEARFMELPDNVQFIAAVNRGDEFSGTYGIDAAQLDRFAPVQMDYPPAEAEVDLLTERHPELSKKLLETIVNVANKLRRSAELGQGLSVRATDEACIYLEHPVLEGRQEKMLPVILQSSFCGRYNGRWSDLGTDAGVAWRIVEDALKEKTRKP